MKNLLTLIALFFILFGGNAQQYPPDGLSGKALRYWLKENWYDGRYELLGYDNSRRFIYDSIDYDNGNLICVYGGHIMSYTKGSSFTEVWPMTTEHSVPQSFFNYAEPMKSDIHHLFVAHNKLNISRSNHPFKDIPDNLTTKWWIDTFSISSIPSSNIDEYSEYYDESFEPREQQKGNTARAIFYFYTMYTGGIRPITDCADVDDIYTWHNTDIPSNTEKKRNDAIEFYQGNRNPYVDYPELLGHAWGFSSPEDKPLINFVRPVYYLHSSLSAGNKVRVEVEISPAPLANETATLSIANSNLASTDYSLSESSLTFTPTSALASFDVEVKSGISTTVEHFIEIELLGLSSNIGEGYNARTKIIITNNLSINSTKYDNVYFYHGVIFNQNPSERTTFEVFDVSGRMLISGHLNNAQTLLNIENKGIYFLKLESEKGFETRKIIF